MFGFSIDPISAALVVVCLLVVAGITLRRRKGHGPPRWDPRPPNALERIIAGIWLFGFIAAAANYSADWRWFDGYDNWVFFAFCLGGLLLIKRLPGVTQGE